MPASCILVIFSVRREIEGRQRLPFGPDVTIGAADTQRLGKELHAAKELRSRNVLWKHLEVLVRRLPRTVVAPLALRWVKTSALQQPTFQT